MPVEQIKYPDNLIKPKLDNESLKEKEWADIISFLESQALEITQKFIEDLCLTNPSFKNNFTNFQEANSKKFIQMIIDTSQIKEEKNDIKNTLLEKAFLSDISYIDLKQEKWEFKVVQKENNNLDKKELQEIVDYLEQNNIKEKIRFAYDTGKDINNLNETEILTLNTIQQDRDLLAEFDMNKILWIISDVSYSYLRTFEEKYDKFIQDLKQWKEDLVYKIKLLSKGKINLESKQSKETKFKEFEEKWYNVFKQINDEKTGFSMTIMEDKNKKFIFSIRWSDEIKDYTKSDIDIIKQKIPEQFISLVRVLYSDKDIKNILDSNKEIEIVWHSLGWTLTQILATLYPNRISNAYNFNWPWIKDMKELDETVLAKLKKENIYLYNLVLQEHQKYLSNMRTYKEILDKKVTNVINKDKIWNYWWKHIWFTTENFWSDEHSLTEMSKDIKKLSNSEFEKIFGKRFKNNNNNY